MTIMLEQLPADLQAMVKRLRPLTALEIQKELDKPTSLIKTFVLAMIALKYMEQFIRNVQEQNMRLTRQEALALYRYYVKSRHTEHHHHVKPEPIKNYLRPVVKIVKDTLNQVFELLQKKVVLDAAYKKDCDDFLKTQLNKVVPVIVSNYAPNQQNKAIQLLGQKIMQWQAKQAVTLERLAELNIPIPAGPSLTPAEQATHQAEVRKVMKIKDTAMFEVELIQLYRNHFKGPHHEHAKKVGKLLAIIKDDISKFQDVKANYFAEVSPINKILDKHDETMQVYTTQFEAIIKKFSEEQKMGIENNLRAAPTPFSTRPRPPIAGK